MKNIVISAEGVGKRYTLNHHSGGAGYRKLSDALVHVAKAPLRWLSAGHRSSSVSQEEFWALKEVDFEVQRGEVVGIIGRNGAGKSTLLKILSRISEPSRGRVMIDGRVASLLEVGTGFHPELTGRENIFLNGAILGMRRGEIRARFDEIVAFAEVEKFLDTPVKRYSSGMYVRLAFAVAAHLEPEILIVDEVLAVGDAQFQAKCLGKMQDVSKKGERTVLFVSHNMGAMKSLCGRGILLQAGRVAATGPIDEVIDAYAQQTHAQSEFRAKPNSSSYVTGCVVHHGDGASSAFFFSNEDIHVSIAFRNVGRISGLRCGLRISTLGGVVLACYTPEDEGRVTPGEPGEYMATVTLPGNTLLKGSYCVTPALWNGTAKEVYDEVPDIAQFTIEAARERAYRSEFARPGLFQTSSVWSFGKAAACGGAALAVRSE